MTAIDLVTGVSSIGFSVKYSQKINFYPARIHSRLYKFGFLEFFLILFFLELIWKYIARYSSDSCEAIVPCRVFLFLVLLWLCWSPHPVSGLQAGDENERLRRLTEFYLAGQSGGRCLTITTSNVTTCPTTLHTPRNILPHLTTVGRNIENIYRICPHMLPSKEPPGKTIVSCSASHLKKWDIFGWEQWQTGSENGNRIQSTSPIGISIISPKQCNTVLFVFDSCHFI